MDAHAVEPQHLANELLPLSGASRQGDPLSPLNALPMCLVLEVPIVDFTVETLIKLQPGDILETRAQHNEDLMLKVNGQPIGAAKFDVTRDQLAVRITGLA